MDNVNSFINGKVNEFCIRHIFFLNDIIKNGLNHFHGCTPARDLDFFTVTYGIIGENSSTSFIIQAGKNIVDIIGKEPFAIESDAEHLSQS
uniref:Uncharacterized protein n=1 Tax=Lepeophtheirus salmonis TaxID=72036 RepID=A0A0K2U4X1_LEPSM